MIIIRLQRKGESYFAASIASDTFMYKTNDQRELALGKELRLHCVKPVLNSCFE